MIDGYRPDLIEITASAYEQMLKAQFDCGLFPGKTWEQVLAEAPPIGPQRRCGMGESVLGAGMCMWPQKDRVVTFCHDRLKDAFNLPWASIDRAYRRGAQMWNAVCGIRLTYTADFNAANIFAIPANMGGKGGVLADSFLSCGVSASGRLQQRYDTSEGWTESFFAEVAGHEIGHACGMEHSSSKSDLMWPYAGAVDLPGPGDIKRMVERYGNPVVVPPEPPPTEPGIPQVSSFLTVINGYLFEYTPRLVT